MKKWVFTMVCFMLLSVCINSNRAGAYSVSVKGDSIYTEVIPEQIMKHVPEMFKSRVEKAKRYYEKYKDADMSAYIKKIPNEQTPEHYRDFIEVAKQIGDKDEIVIHYPFCCYSLDSGSDYYFVAEKNHQRLCVFSISADEEKGKLDFNYDAMESRYLQLDENEAAQALIYEIKGVYYAETPEKVREIRNTTVSGMTEMEGTESTDQKAIDRFVNKSYREKKEEIFSYLRNVKEGKEKKKTLAMPGFGKEGYTEMEYEYGETAPVHMEESGEKSRTGKYVLLCLIIGTVFCAVIGTGISVYKKKKRYSE